MTNYHKLNLKEEILTCTIQMISAEGYQSVSVRKIAKRLGVSPTSIYRHYNNLEDLFKQALIYFGKQLSTFLVYKEEESPERNLELMGIRFIEFATIHKNEFEFLFLSDYSFKKISLIDHKELPLISVMTFTIKKINNIKNQQILFNQLWSFILGYAILVTKQELDYSEELIQKTVQNFLK